MNTKTRITRLIALSTVLWCAPTMLYARSETEIAHPTSIKNQPAAEQIYASARTFIDDWQNTPITSQLLGGTLCSLLPLPPPLC
jgi:hypothetical protein